MGLVDLRLPWEICNKSPADQSFTWRLQRAGEAGRLRKQPTREQCYGARDDKKIRLSFRIRLKRSENLKQVKRYCYGI